MAEQTFEVYTSSATGTQIDNAAAKVAAMEEALSGTAGTIPSSAAVKNYVDSKSVDYNSVDYNKVDSIPSTNLVNPEACEYGKIIRWNGTFGANSRFTVSGYIKVNEKNIKAHSYGSSGDWAWGIVYNKNKEQLRIIESTQYTYQEGDYYVRFCFLYDNTVSNLYANYGTTLADYEPYVDYAPALQIEKLEKDVFEIGHPIWDDVALDGVFDAYLPTIGVGETIGICTIVKDTSRNEYRFNVYKVNTDGSYSDVESVGTFKIPFTKANGIVIVKSVYGENYLAIDFNLLPTLSSGINTVKSKFSSVIRNVHYGAIYNNLELHSLISSDPKYDEDHVTPSVVYLTQDSYRFMSSMPQRIYIDHFVNFSNKIYKVSFDKTKNDVLHLCASLESTLSANKTEQTESIAVSGFSSLSSFNLKKRISKSTNGANKEVRLLFIGDSVGGGYGGDYNTVNSNPGVSWAITQKLFMLDCIKSGDGTKHKMQCLGFRNAYPVSATYNNTTKNSVAYGEGRGGWSLVNYLYDESRDSVYNPFYDANKVWSDASLNSAGVKFSVSKYLERFRNYTDAGQKISEGGTGIGTNVTFSGTSDTSNLIVRDNEEYVNTPTHIIVQLGFNDGADTPFADNIEYIIKAIREELPDVIIGISLIDESGGYFSENYRECANDANFNLLGQSLHTKMFNRITNVVAKCDESDNVFFIPNYFIQPTIEGAARIEASSIDGITSWFSNNEIGLYHPNNIAHSAWGLQIYSWLKWTLES